MISPSTESCNPGGVLLIVMAVLSLSGLPALSVPCGLSEGLPVGLQVMAPALADDLIYRVAAAVEASYDHPLIDEVPAL